MHSSSRSGIKINQASPGRLILLLVSLCSLPACAVPKAEAVSKSPESVRQAASQTLPPAATLTPTPAPSITPTLDPPSTPAALPVLHIIRGIRGHHQYFPLGAGPAVRLRRLRRPDR
ncbi:MAG TPA: hypothetical protein VMT46_06210 [Anaerolineaceae bacterium]|nr:hypothetical protein [Anaerolineaceae bacterium]